MSKQTLSGVKLALTIDDLFMWPGVPFGEGQSAKQVSKQLTDAFAKNGVKSVYAFSCTKPAGASLESVLDAWCSAGHHVGNHTHNHCSINTLARRPTTCSWSSRRPASRTPRSASGSTTRSS